MGGQGLDRREVLRILSLAAVASQFTGFDRWSFALCDAHADTGLVKPHSSAYKPQFFSSNEYATLECLTELIIPSDGTPGAREAGVSEFIDFMVASDPEIQYGFRYGLVWMDTHAKWLFEHPFCDLDAAGQNDMLEHLAYTDRYRSGEKDGRAFFELLREYTVMGFYTSRIGLEQLDYPGLQQVYTEMPGCPHPGDPEHRHLPPAADSGGRS